MNGCRLQEIPTFITIQSSNGNNRPLPAQIVRARCKWSLRRAVVRRQFSNQAHATSAELISRVKKNRPDHMGKRCAETRPIPSPKTAENRAIHNPKGLRPPLQGERKALPKKRAPVILLTFVRTPKLHQML